MTTTTQRDVMAVAVVTLRGGDGLSVLQGLAMNDLFDLNARAGKRTTPYPGEAERPDAPRCANSECHAPLTGERGRDGWAKVYCSDACRKYHASRLQFAAQEAARHERKLGLGVSNWRTER